MMQASIGPIEAAANKPFEQRSTRIIREVAAKHRVRPTDITGPSRSHWACVPRHEAAFRLVTEVGMSMPQAGRVLGGRDHTTILNSLRKFTRDNPAATVVLEEARSRKAERPAIYIPKFLHLRGLPPPPPRAPVERPSSLPAVLRLHEEAQPIKTISGKLGITEGHVRKMLQRAGRVPVEQHNHDEGIWGMDEDKRREAFRRRAALAAAAARKAALA